MRALTFALWLCVACSGLLVVAAQQTAPLVLEGARLIVGDGRVIESGTLIIDNGRIARAGRSADVQRPRGAIRLDVAGKTIMPALIDAHLHVGYENMSGWQAEN